MKRTAIAKLAIFFILAAVLTSCAGETISLLPFISEFDSEIDFEGTVFRIRNHGTELNYVAPNEVPTARKELLLNRLDELQTKYNCEIRHSCGDPADYATFYVSGIPEADILFGQVKYLYQLYSAGYFMNVYDIPNMDLSDGRFGSPQFIETFTFNNELIGIFPQHWGYSQIGFSNALNYNPEIFKELNLQNPNELYEQGKWNWDALQTIGEACLVAGSEDKPLYMSTFNNYFVRMLILSNGGEYITLNDNGKYRYALTDPRVTEALQFAHDLSKTGYLDTIDSNIATNNFADGMYALISEYSGAAFGYYNYKMQGGVGHCYLPDGPRAEDNTKGVLSIENPLWSVTREKEESSADLGNFLTLLFAPLDEVAGDWKFEFTAENFFDDMSAEVYLTMNENVYFDRVVFAYTDGKLWDIVYDAAKTGAIAENIQSVAEVVNHKLDESINSWD